VTITLPAVVDGCEMFSQTLREKQRLRAFKSIVVRAKMFVPEREKVTGMWRKFCNEPHDLYASLNII
jgi:hypothetical protein